MPSLFELTKLSVEIDQQFALSGGEITPEIEAMLGDLNLTTAMADKIDAYEFVMSKLKSAEAWAKGKTDEIYELQMSYKKAQKVIRGRLLAAMELLQVNQLNGNTCVYKKQGGKSSLEIDETKLDKSYFMEVRTTVPDKERIEADLKAGKTILGATLKRGVTLRPYYTSQAMAVTK